MEPAREPLGDAPFKPSPPAATGGLFVNSDVVRTLIEIWARLPADDPDNLGFSDAIKALHLDERQRGLLQSAGARDLRTIAEAIRSTPVIDRYNESARERSSIYKEEKRAGSAPAPVRWPLSTRDATAMLTAIGAGLGSGGGEEPPKKTRRSRARR